MPLTLIRLFPLALAVALLAPLPVSARSLNDSSGSQTSTNTAGQSPSSSGNNLSTNLGGRPANSESPTPVSGDNMHHPGGPASNHQLLSPPDSPPSHNGNNLAPNLGGIYQSGDYNDNSDRPQNREVAERYRQMDRAQRDRRHRTKKNMEEWRKRHIKTTEEKPVTKLPPPKPWHPKPAAPLPDEWKNRPLQGDNLRQKDDHGNCRYTNRGWACKGDEQTPGNASDDADSGDQNAPEYKKMLQECQNIQNHPQVIRDGNRWVCNHGSTEEKPHSGDLPPYNTLPYERPCLRNSLGINDHCNNRPKQPPVYICRNKPSDTPYLLTEAEYHQSAMRTNAPRERLCERYSPAPTIEPHHQGDAYFRSGGGLYATQPYEPQPADKHETLKPANGDSAPVNTPGVKHPPAPPALQ